MSQTPIFRVLAVVSMISSLLLLGGCRGAELSSDSEYTPVEESGTQAESDSPVEDEMASDGAMAPETMNTDLDGLVQIKLTEFGIESTHDSFQTGVAYRFVVLNEGVIAHDLRLTPRGEAAAMVAMQTGSEPHTHGTELIYVPEEEMGPGVIYTTDLTFTQPGEYELACHVNGHFQAGMWQPIEVVGEVMATPTPIDPDSVIYDPSMMPDAPCHVMGTTIMGDCTEEDIATIRARLLGTSVDDEHGHEPDTPEEHGHDDEDGMMDEGEHMDEGGMMDDSEEGHEGEGAMGADHSDEAGEDAGGEDQQGGGSDG